MVKIAISLVLSTLISCGGQPATTSVSVKQFTVVSEQADPASRSLTLLIRVTEPTTTEKVKSIVESVIETRKTEFAQITVKTYLEGMTSYTHPYAVSKLEAGSVSHKFSALAEPEKIHTH